MKQASDKQLELENQMREAGVARFNARVQQNINKNDFTVTPAGKQLLKGAVFGTGGDEQASLVAGIQEFMAACESAKGGPKHGAYKLLKGMDIQRVAAVTASTVVDIITKQLKLTGAAIGLANNLEDIVRFSEFKKEHKAYYETVERNMRTNHVSHARRVFGGAADRLDVEWEGWERKLKLHLGTKLIEIFIESTGLCDKQLRTMSRRKTAYYIVPNENTLEWIRSKHASIEALTPVYMPMVDVPVRWEEGKLHGGYYTLNRKTLVKAHTRQEAERMSQMEMPEVYDAVNAIQETPWTVNNRVLEVMSHVWYNTDGLGIIINREPLPVPEKPHDIDTNREALKKWKKAAATIHNKNHDNTAKQIIVARVLAIAEKYKDETFYFPHFLDARGRAYPIPQYLNPQGADVSKGLLQFAEGEPLGDSGVAWLAIHGANSFGVDKVSFNDRIEWAEENTTRICLTALDPYADLWWTEADSPWQFLAFCFEWAGYVVHRDDFVSHIPVGLDGSCNGLQHFSAMLKDEIGGEQVNLTPGEKPADVYAAVASKAKELVEADAQGDDEEKKTLAQQWLDSGAIGRKLAKRPTMTLVYGATHYGTYEQMLEVVREMVEKDGLQIGDPEESVRYINPIIWQALDAVVVKAREAMDWLQDAARIAAEENQYLSWTTPAGLQVRQDKKKTTEKKVEITFFGWARVSVRSATNQMDKRKQANCIAPNWVHSMDAAHMMLTVNQCSKESIAHFAMVHDSFGTHAANAEALSEILRKVFVEIHSVDLLGQFEHDIRSKLSDEANEKLGPLPKTGKLDLELVKDSEYFFA